MSKVIVVGAGAAGMLAALGAAERGHQVTILEKNEKTGKKMFITGKGRCNVTNACDTEDFFQGIVTNARFMYSSLYGFTKDDLMALLERHGCPLKVERGNRVFPVSDKSSDVIGALTGALRKKQVEIRLRTEVAGLIIKERHCLGVTLKDGCRMEADAVVVATGGLSYPTTGSTGDGLLWARQCGHKIIDPTPALVPFCAGEEMIKDLQGLSLKNIRITIKKETRTLYEDFGEMLFTHFGVSGPVILSASSFVTKEIKQQPLALLIDLKPALSAQQLDSRVLRDFGEVKNRQFKNALGQLLPAKLIPVIIKLSAVSPEKQVNEITRAERKKLVDLIKGLPLTLTGLRGYNEAIITQGGICVNEINPSTMESRLVSHLYFAGEMLDLDGVTGGYNLQIAFSTGWAAGTEICAAGSS